jgi:RimJ/RimL family protein N-acetyltransferase
MIDAKSYEVKETLRNGQFVTIRAIRPEDAALLREEVPEIDKHSLYLRFFETRNEFTDKELSYFTDVDFVNHVALVAVADIDDKAKIIASARYFAYDHPTKIRSAEVAFMVHDGHQGKGLATLMMKHLLLIARAGGIEQFEAEVLPENAKMLAVFSKSGLPMSKLQLGGVIHVTMPLSSDTTETVMKS